MRKICVCTLPLLMLYCCVCAHSALATPLIQYDSKSSAVRAVSIESLENGQLLLKVHSPHTKAVSAFTVDSPARMVVDVPLTKSDTNKQFARPVRVPGPEHSRVEALRIAADKKRVRIVTDLRDAVAPAYAMSTEGNVLLIRLGAPTTTVATTTLPDDSRASTHIASVPATPQPPKKTLTLLSARRLGRSSEPEMPVSIPQTQPTLTGIEFVSPTTPGALNATPTIRFVTTHQPRYRLSRKDDRTYVLRISDSLLASSRLSLPFFPPQEFEGFTMVQAAQSGSDVEITLALERGARITAVPGASEILIQLTQN